MTFYAGLHYGFAVYSGFMAVLHLAVWLSSPRDRSQLWVSITFAGWALDTYVMGTTSVAANGTLTPTLNLLHCLSTFPIFIGIPMTVWTLAGRRITPWRWALLGTGVPIAIYRLLETQAVVSSATPGPVEAIQLDPSLPSAWAFWFFAILLCVVWAVEGVRLLRTRRSVGVLMLLAIVPAGAMVGSDILIMFGAYEGPSMLDFAGFIFAFFASVLNALEFVRARRRLDQGDIDRYRLVRRIGAGGMGELFLAVRTGPEGFERQVALKRMLRKDAARSEWIDRFLLEARIAAGLHHPNIVAVNDLGRLDYGWFMVMEFLDGLNLAEIRNHFRARNKAVEALAPTVDRVPAAVIASVGEQVCKGLAHAHGLGVLHRDISPQNIMVTRAGHVKVIDFGIAKARFDDPDGPLSPIDPSGSSDLTAAGKVIGKSAYMSPDRLSGKNAVEGDDLFALAVVLYELATGFRPFRQKEAPARLDAMKAGDFLSLQEARSDLPVDLARAIHQGLAARASERYTSAEQMAAALAAVRRSLDEIDLADWMRTTFVEEVTAPVPEHTGETAPTLKGRNRVDENATTHVAPGNEPPAAPDEAVDESVKAD